VERLLTERGDAVPMHEKARAEQLIADARQAMGEDAPVDRLRSLTQELQAMYQSLSSARAEGATADVGGGAAGGATGGGADDDVIDAEFTSG
jgi:molecular chaperone DnaK